MTKPKRIFTKGDLFSVRAFDICDDMMKLSGILGDFAKGECKSGCVESLRKISKQFSELADLAESMSECELKGKVN
jgi:hypothetical protein